LASAWNPAAHVPDPVRAELKELAAASQMTLTYCCPAVLQQAAGEPDRFLPAPRTPRNAVNPVTFNDPFTPIAATSDFDQDAKVLLLEAPKAPLLVWEDAGGKMAKEGAAVPAVAVSRAGSAGAD
jgi:hypothetical protein